MTQKSTQIETAELLQNLGLKKREARIYLSLLENGAMLPQHLATNTGIKRTTLYEYFPEMIKEGFIYEIRQGKRRLFRATAPDKLFYDYRNRYKETRNNINELMAIYRMQGLKPKMEFYEGFNGVKRVFMDTLRAKKELLNFTQVTKYNEKMMGWLVNVYVPLRIKKGIRVKAMVPKKIETRRFMPEGERYLRTTRSIPWNKFPFRIEGLIYNNKIAYAHYEKGGPLVGIIIESKQITDTQRALFNLAWEGAEKYQEK